MTDPRASRAPVQAAGEVLSVKRLGDYVHLTIVAGTVAERSRPGCFVMLAIGGDESAMLIPRPFWVHRSRSSGTYGGTIEVAFTIRGAATRWLAGLRPLDKVAVTGPLGRTFALPKQPVVCAVVGHGYGAAPLFLLAERLRERDCGVHMVLGGATEQALLGVLEARRATQSVTVTTIDGSAGARGCVSDVLPAVLASNGVDVVYACGPFDVLHKVEGAAAPAGVWCQVAVEAPMACGVGICQSCVLPVKGDDGVTRPARCCAEGPVFAADRVDWPMLDGR